MLTQAPFYFSSIRNVVVGFGKLFNNIQIQRLKENGTVEKIIKVPLAYASGDKTITMLKSQVETRNKDLIEVKITLPRMSYEITNIALDNTRMTQHLIKNHYPAGNSNSVLTQFKPMPYNVEFSLYAFVKYMDDGLQIIEQILPYFRPNYAFTIQPIKNVPNFTFDVPITINSVSHEDTYEGQVEEDRILQWTLTFTAHTWVFPPITNAKVIKRVFNNFYDLNNNEKISSITVEVDPITANENDNWKPKITYNE